MSDIRNLEIDLDIKQNLLVTINCKQLDNLNLKFNIWDNGQVADLSNYKCRLKALKSDQIPLIQNTDISISGNIVTAEADEQLTTTSGLVKTELQFIDKTTGKKKSTFNLNIKVISSTLEVDRTISKATITLLEELDNKLDQIEDIGDVLDEAKVVKTELEIDIATGNTAKSNLETATTNANTKKQEVNTAITNATTKIIDVNTSITNAQTTKTALDTSKSNADISKSNLDTANTLAEHNIEELNKLGDVTDLAEKVETNTNLIAELNQNDTDMKTTIGTETMGTTATTLKGAIKEVKGIADNNTTQLNENTQEIENIKKILSTTFSVAEGYKASLNAIKKDSNGRCILYGIIKKTDGGVFLTDNPIVLGTIPAGFIPMYAINAPIRSYRGNVNQSSDPTMMLLDSANGNITISNIVDNTVEVQFTIAYDAKEV